MSKPLLTSPHQSPDPGCGQASSADWERKRALLRARLMKRRLPWLNKDELEAHFAGMPWRYWTRVSQDDLRLHLRTVRAFFQSLMAPETEGSADHTPLHIVAADRLGLLYEILQALTACGVNISQAIVCTDNGLARDLFHLTDVASGTSLGASRLETIRARLLEVMNP